MAVYGVHIRAIEQRKLCFVCFVCLSKSSREFIVHFALQRCLKYGSIVWSGLGSGIRIWEFIWKGSPADFTDIWNVAHWIIGFWIPGCDASPPKSSITRIASDKRNVFSFHHFNHIHTYTNIEFASCQKLRCAHTAHTAWNWTVKWQHMNKYVYEIWKHNPLYYLCGRNVAFCNISDSVSISSRYSMQANSIWNVQCRICNAQWFDEKILAYYLINILIRVPSLRMQYIHFQQCKASERGKTCVRLKCFLFNEFFVSPRS